MDELLKQTGYALKGLQRGDQVEGTITYVTPRQVRVDVGSKTEAVVHDKELSLVADLIDEFSVGSSVHVHVVTPENDKGYPVVSLRRAAFDKRWELLEQKRDEDEIITVTVTDTGKGGFLIHSIGIRGFLPYSQAEQKLVDSREKAKGQRVRVKVLEVDSSANRFVVSQRFEGQRGALGRQVELLKEIKEGQTYTAEITGVVSFGAFAKVRVSDDEPGLEGLIHISEIAWEKVEDPADYVQTGQSREVKVIGVDKRSGRLTLSLKQLQPDPWEDVGRAFEPEQTVEGEITRVSPYGVFVRLVPGIEGLVHISKIPPGEEPKVGDHVSCMIEEVDSAHRKISLSLVSTAKPIGYR